MQRQQLVAKFKADALAALAGGQIGDVRLRNAHARGNFVLSEAAGDERGDDVFPHGSHNSICFCWRQARDNSMRLFHAHTHSCEMNPMETADIRRKNLRRWIDTDPVSRGNVEAWCSHYSRFSDKPITPSYIRQLVPERGKPSRNIGERVARKLEIAGGKPVGFLDRVDGNDGESGNKSHFNQDAQGKQVVVPRALTVHDVPILTYGDIMNGRHNDLDRLDHPRPRVPVRTTDFSAGCFGLVLRDNSMAGGDRPLQKGMMVIIDPDRVPQNEEIVLLREPQSEPVVRQYWREGAASYARATGAQIPVREIDPRHIVGVVCGVYYTF